MTLSSISGCSCLVGAHNINPIAAASVGIRILFHPPDRVSDSGLHGQSDGVAVTYDVVHRL